MSRAVLSVTQAGPLVSLQDQGRSGYMRFGVPESGPMDRLSFAAAQAALGNSPSTPLIEVSLGGLALRCESGSVSVAVTGGGFRVTCGAAETGSWSVVTLTAGQTLAVRPGFWGSWCYVAFAGELAAPQWLGSAATHTLSGLGGGKLVQGQELTVATPRIVRERSIACPIMARPRHTVRVTMGPQDRFFDQETIAAFRNGPWRLSDQSDRMGVRLSGPVIAPLAALTIVSEPITRGAVQVAGDGVAAVLLADHQTTGGYPKIATVIDCDLDAFAQLRPRAPVAFRVITPEDALAISRRKALWSRLYLGSMVAHASRAAP
jgi:allophanate hydrolase